MSKNLNKAMYYMIGGLAGLSVLFMILLICLNNQNVSIGKTYNYQILGNEININFKDENIAFVYAESKIAKATYNIDSNNNLYIKPENESSWKLFGKINAYEIIVNPSIIGIYNTEVKLECKSATTAKTLYIIFMILAFLGMTTCIGLQYFLNKQNKQETTNEIH